MKRFLIEDLSEVACAMYDSIMDDGVGDVMFVGRYDDVSAIIKHLLVFDETVPYHINFEPEDWDEYDREYYVTLDGDMNIWCEEAYNFEHEYYLYIETGRLFITDDCNSAILKEIGCNEDSMYEVTYDLCDEEFECECDGNCENCDSGQGVINELKYISAYDFLGLLADMLNKLSE